MSKKNKSLHKLGKDDVFIIAEIGKNFIDSEERESVSVYIQKAKKLIDAAVFAGVDAVKFQTHEVEDEQANIHIVSPHFRGSDRYSWVSWNTEITPVEFWREIKGYADKKGITFFSTPMSRRAAIKLEDLGVPFWKVGSGDVEDYVLLDFLTQTQKPIIISTGMVSRDELDRVVRYIQNRGNPLTILYCVSKYPCPPVDFNLASIKYLQEKYPGVTVGFSDHSVDGHEVDLAAVKLGAQVIEKHFSFSRELWGSDHKASVTPDEMKKMVSDIRSGVYREISYDKFYGDKEKEFEGADNQFRSLFKKTLVATTDIKKGTVIMPHMIHALRPQAHLDGIHSHEFHLVVGKKTIENLKKNQPIQKKHIK